MHEVSLFIVTFKAFRFFYADYVFPHLRNVYHWVVLGAEVLAYWQVLWDWLSDNPCHMSSPVWLSDSHPSAPSPYRIYEHNTVPHSAITRLFLSLIGFCFYHYRLWVGWHSRGEFLKTAYETSPQWVSPLNSDVRQMYCMGPSRHEVKADPLAHTKHPPWGRSRCEQLPQTLSGEGSVFGVVETGVWFSLLPRGSVMSVQATQGEYFLFVS